MASSSPAPKSSGEEASRGEVLYNHKQPWEWKCVKSGSSSSGAKDLAAQGKKSLGAKSEEEASGARSSPSWEESKKEQHNSGSSMGLKLGKRTYFEDGHESSTPTSGGSSKPSPPPASSTPPANPSPTPPAKKGRAGAQAAVIPKCQVEGCKADLSGSKDYHRRHKVCEVHSKTPKNIVNGLEQRFCQQCSRFHLLSEFDEGKRSCRRRLAGHNERRRKPQPDALAAYGMGNVSSFQAAYQRLGVGSSILMDHGEALGYGAGGSWRFGGSHPQLLSKHLVENLSADKLLLLLQNSKRPTGLPTITASATTTTTTTTSSTAGGSNTLVHPNPKNLQQQHHSHHQDQMKLTLASNSSQIVGEPGGGGLSPVNESSRALSLLSADAWAKSSATTPGYDLSSSSSQPQPQFVLAAGAPASPVDSKKNVNAHHHHHRSQAQDAIPIPASSSSRASQQHQQQQGSYSLGSWKYSGSSGY